MITTTSLKSLSPLSAKPKATLAGKASSGPALSPLPEDQAEISRPAPQRGLAHWGLAAASAVAGLSGLMAMPAQAQVIQVPAPTLDGTLQVPAELEALRNQHGVRAHSIDEVVQKFSAERQLYVVGNPLFKGQPVDLAGIQRMLSQHPHRYVVLVAQSDNMTRDDRALSRGIGNHPEFKALKEATTGQPDGALMMIYFNVTDQSFVQKSGGNRAIFLRTEQLLDDAGVGENNFMERETFRPQELMTTYRNAISSGRDVAGAAGAVFERMDSGVERFLRDSVGATQEQLNLARTALQKHSRPEWEALFQTAQQQFEARQYRQAQETARQVQAAVSNYQAQLDAFQQAPGRAQQVQLILNEAERLAASMPTNGTASQARAQLDLARQAMQDFREAQQAKDLSSPQYLAQAESAAQQAKQMANAAITRAQVQEQLKMAGLGLLAGAVLLTGLIMRRRAQSGQEEAERELLAAREKLDAKVQELEVLLSKASYAEMTSFQGQTQKLTSEIVTHLAEALTASGGGQKLLAQAKSLIGAKGLTNFFTRIKFERAQNLLREGKPSFDRYDLKQLPQLGAAEDWRQEILKNLPNQEFSDTLQGLIAKIEVEMKAARPGLAQLRQEQSEIGPFLQQQRSRWQELQQAAKGLKEEGGLFQLASLEEGLIPAVAPQLAKAEELSSSDPLRSRREPGNQAASLNSKAESLLTSARWARQELLPGLAKVASQLKGSDVDTQWSRDRSEQLSLQLDLLGRQAIHNEIEPSLAQHNTDQNELLARANTVLVLQDERTVVIPGLLAGVEKELAQAAKTIEARLQAKAFQDLERSPQQVLRQSRQALERVAHPLSSGDVEQAGTQLQQTRQEGEKARLWVKESLDTLESFPEQAKQQLAGFKEVEQRLPLLRGRLEHCGFHPAALAQECQGLSATTLLEQVQEGLAQGRAGLGQAQQSYTQARLLDANSGRQSSQTQLEQSESQLSRVSSALRSLEFQHNQNVEKQTQLQGRYAALQPEVGQKYLGAESQALFTQFGQALERVKPHMMGQPHPLSAASELALAATLEEKCSQAFKTDKTKFAMLHKNLADLPQLLADAQTRIDHVAQVSWSKQVVGYGTVSHHIENNDLNFARQLLAEARSEHQAAQQKLAQEQFGPAADSSQISVNRATEANKSANDVLIQGKRTFASKVEDAERQAYTPPPSYDPPSYEPPSYNPPSYEPPSSPPTPPSYEPPPSYDPPPSYEPPPSYDPPSNSGGGWNGGGGDSGSTGGSW